VGCLVGVGLQRVRERSDEELICCFVLEDLESDGNNYFGFLVGQVGGASRGI
jgi:hypothetical protein